MRARTIITAVAATAALTSLTVAPAGAGIAATVTLDPNPAYVGDTVTITPLGGCVDYELGAPTVEIQVTGPESSTFDVTPTYNGDMGRYDWEGHLTAGPVGVYTVTATCLYDAPLTDTLARQQVDYPYAPATLQVIAAQVTTTTTAAPTTTTTAASTTTAPTATAAAPAAPVAASPRFTG